MSYGISIFNQQSQLLLSVTDRYLRLYHNQTINGNGSINISDISGKQTVQWIQPNLLTFIDSSYGSISVYRNNDVISWSVPSYPGWSGTLFIFVYT